MANRVAVVTGGGAGMGFAIAQHLARRGDRVVVIDLKADVAEQAAASIVAEGGVAIGCGADVSDRAAVAAAYERTRAELGPIEILVTSAGIDEFGPFTEITVETWQKIIDVNLTGTFHCIQLAIPDMLEAGFGRILTISSSSAQSGAKKMAHYVASKGGVMGLTKALAVEYARSGITVNTIPPGFIDTPMARRAEERGDLPDMDVVAAHSPMGRAGTPDDIGVAAAFITSDEAGYITGQSINVNGGLYL
jgi:NAD(P)-dependent dehydrogenase (short-subunit alcohol dehydrogenase family)